MSVDSTSLSMPSFSVDFWQPYAPATAPSHTAGTGDRAGTPALSYSPERHGTHAAFFQGPDFPQYKEEVRANLSFLADYCRQHQVSDADAIAVNLLAFFNHRFEDLHYFSTRTELVDSIGKQSLDQFCWMIRHENIDLEVKKIAIRDLAMGMAQCADGAVSNLVGAARKLDKAAGGLRSRLWAIKEEIARSVLQEVSQEWFAWRQTYAGNEIHYVNTAWNIVADRYGFEKYPDGIRMLEARDRRFLLNCNAQLKSVLTPDRLSLTIAETCQARFNDQVPTAIEHSCGTWTTGIEALCADKLQEIGDEFGLTCDDELRFDPEDQAWKPREGDLRLKSFLKLEENGDTATYRVRNDPSLIALDLLRSMAGLNLLRDVGIPQVEGEWTEPDGMRTAVFSYGELAWVARAFSRDAFQGPLWESKGVEIESVTVPDLLQCYAGQPEAMRAPAEVVLSQAIRATDAAQLVQMPARWLPGTALLERLLRRLDEGEATAYLARNAADLGTELANRKRYKVLGCIMRLGLSKAIPGVIAQWFAEPSEGIDMVDRLLRRDALPAFHQAMLEDDAKTAVRAWYEPLRESSLLVLAAPRLGALLNHGDRGSSALAWAISQGRAAAVEAFFRLLQDILIDRGVQWHIKAELPSLLLTTDSLHKPALSFAMAMGHTAAVKAFYAGVQDLLKAPALDGPIRQPLLKALPNLLAGMLSRSNSGLSYALQNGRTEIIQAFHEVLKDLISDASIGPHLHAALPSMLVANNHDGESGVSIARRRGYRDTLAVFLALLADPAIQPYVGQALFDQLTAESGVY